MNQVDDMVGPSWWETCANNMVKPINNVMHHWVYTMFEKLHLETLLIRNLASSHLPDCLPDMCIMEHVARVHGGCDKDKGLTKKIIKGNSMGEHGLFIKFGMQHLLDHNNWGLLVTSQNYLHPRFDSNLDFM